MAKMGEGDARWIVSEIGNTNPGSWHWEAKCLKKSCQERLTQLFEEAAIASDVAEGYLKVTELKTLTGDAELTTRKGGKKFPIYDLVLTLAWEAQLPGNEAKITGEVKVEEIASGSDDSDYIYSVTATGTGAAQDECKKLALCLKPKVYAVIAKFIDGIHEQ